MAGAKECKRGPKIFGPCRILPEIHQGLCGYRKANFGFDSKTYLYMENRPNGIFQKSQESVGERSSTGPTKNWCSTHGDDGRIQVCNRGYLRAKFASGSVSFTQANGNRDRLASGGSELLAFLIALQKWDVYLKGFQFHLKTDHEPIRYLQSKPRLSLRQQRWLDLFQQYDFTISHLKGIENVAADALSRRADLQFKRLCKEGPSFLNRIIEAQKVDPFSRKMRKKLPNPEEVSEAAIQKAYRNFSIDNEILIWTGSGKNRIYVPNKEDVRKNLIDEFHKKIILEPQKFMQSYINISTGTKCSKISKKGFPVVGHA